MTFMTFIPVKRDLDRQTFTYQSDTYYFLEKDVPQGKNVEAILKIWKEKVITDLWAEQFAQRAGVPFRQPVVIRESLIFEPSCKCINPKICEDHTTREKASLRLKLIVQYKPKNRQ